MASLMANIHVYLDYRLRHAGLMVSVIASGSSGLGLNPGWKDCVVFLVKALYLYSASLHPAI